MSHKSRPLNRIALNDLRDYKPLPPWQAPHSQPLSPPSIHTRINSHGVNVAITPSIDEPKASIPTGKSVWIPTISESLFIQSFDTNETASRYGEKLERILALHKELSAVRPLAVLQLRTLRNDTLLAWRREQKELMAMAEKERIGKALAILGLTVEQLEMIKAMR